MILYRPGKWRLEFLRKPTRAPTGDAAAWRQERLCAADAMHLPLNPHTARADTLPQRLGNSEREHNFARTSSSRECQEAESDLAAHL